MLNNLPTTEFSIAIDIAGEETGTQYKGEFVFKKLTNKEKIEVEKWISKMVGLYKQGDDLAEYETSRRMYRLFSNLRFGMVKVPSWWEESNYGLDIYDFNIVNAIVEAKEAAEKNWIAKIQSMAENVTVPQPNE